MNLRELAETYGDGDSDVEVFARAVIDLLETVEFASLNLNECDECKKGENPPWCKNECEVRQKARECLQRLAEGK